MEEVAVRANLAIDHKNFLNDFMSNHGSEDTEAMEMEYDGICAQVDKITLKLFFKMMEAAKVESALDLVHRLHHEQSFEIAMMAADKSNFRKLSDRIFSIKEDRFDLDEDDDLDDDESFDGSHTAFPRDNQTKNRSSSANVSPDQSNLVKNEFKTQDKHLEKPKSRKRINPFATNTKKSPGKTTHVKKLQKKEPTLSRMSTFSAESRRKSKGSKEIL